MVRATGWRVVSQRHTERYMPSGNFEDVVEVHIVTDNGTPKVFYVPEAQYNADHVADLGNEWVARHDQVAALGNTP